MSKYYRKNTLFFQQKFPALIAAIAKATPQTKAVLDEDGEIIDVDFGSGRLYGTSAHDACNQQLANYLSRPERIVINRPTEKTFSSDLSVRTLKFLEAAAEGIRLNDAPKNLTGYLVVIGLGLGTFLEELIEKTDARHIIIAEPIGEFLAHSLKTVNWAGIGERLAAEGKTLDLVTEPEPVDAIHRIETLFQAYGLPIMDGAYIYVHYNTAVTEAIHNGVRGAVRLLMISRGYFEDEVIMADNFIANVTRFPFKLIDGIKRPPRPEPVFIIGSGPSIDACLDHIEKWRDKAIIVTSGSSLQIVLGRGIVPDFHVEKENLLVTAKRLAHIAEANADRFPDGIFTDIPLIASATVHPETSRLFTDHSYFFRDSVCSTHFFGGGYHYIEGISPFSANTSMSVMATLGFRDFYLFGVDCAVKLRDRHHSENTYYFTMDDHVGQSAHNYDTKVAGNFGGDVFADSAFEWSRSIFEQTIKVHGLTVANCSDGARIEGARPLHPEDLHLDGSTLDKKAVQTAVHESSESYSAGEFLARLDPTVIPALWDDFEKAFRAELDTALRQDTDFEAFQYRIKTFLNGGATRWGGVWVMVQGSAFALLPIGYWFACRTEDEAKRRELVQAFIGQFKDLMVEICQKGRVMFETERGMS